MTVSQINRYIAAKLSFDPKLKGVMVKGELAEFRINAASGHAYFTLKDESSQIRGVMFSSNVKRLGFMPEKGLSVICSGSIDTYVEGGIYQIKASELVPTGVGAQFLRLDALKKKLAQQGLFDERLKKPLPYLPKKIAVVTSPSGAAVRDVIKVLKRRYPIGSIELIPTLVQGAEAPKSIVRALDKADKCGADVIILTRGGGAYEDLMAFNAEEVVRAISACSTPLISAVGHETDTTLSDYAADRRAPTPSAAAEICAPDVDMLMNAVKKRRISLDGAFTAYTARCKAMSDMLAQRLAAVCPSAYLAHEQGRVSLLTNRLDTAYAACLYAKKNNYERIGRDLTYAFKNYINERCSKADTLSLKLETLSPYKALERGYTLTFKDSKPVMLASQLREGDMITIAFSDSSVSAVVVNKNNIEENNNGK